MGHSQPFRTRAETTSHPQPRPAATGRRLTRSTLAVRYDARPPRHGSRADAADDLQPALRPPGESPRRGRRPGHPRRGRAHLLRRAAIGRFGLLRRADAPRLDERRAALRRPRRAHPVRRVRPRAAARRCPGRARRGTLRRHRQTPRLARPRARADPWPDDDRRRHARRRRLGARPRLDPAQPRRPPRRPPSARDRAGRLPDQPQKQARGRRLPSSATDRCAVRVAP